MKEDLQKPRMNQSNVVRPHKETLAIFYLLSWKQQHKIVHV